MVLAMERVRLPVVGMPIPTGPVPADPDGVARTPRGDLRAGRVPWATNVPAAHLYRPDGTMKSIPIPKALRDRLDPGATGTVA